MKDISWCSSRWWWEEMVLGLYWWGLAPLQRLNQTEEAVWETVKTPAVSRPLVVGFSFQGVFATKIKVTLLKRCQSSTCRRFHWTALDGIIVKSRPHFEDGSTKYSVINLHLTVCCPDYLVHFSSPLSSHYTSFSLQANSSRERVHHVRWRGSAKNVFQWWRCCNVPLYIVKSEEKNTLVLFSG